MTVKEIKNNPDPTIQLIQLNKRGYCQYPSKNKKYQSYIFSSV